MLWGYIPEYHQNNLVAYILLGYVPEYRQGNLVGYILWGYVPEYHQSYLVLIGYVHSGGSRVHTRVSPKYPGRVYTVGT